MLTHRTVILLAVSACLFTTTSVAEAGKPTCYQSSVKAFAMGKSQKTVKSAGTMDYKSYLSKRSWMMPGKSYGVSGKKAFSGELRFYVNRTSGKTPGDGVVCGYDASGRVVHNKSFSFSRSSRYSGSASSVDPIFYAVVLNASGGWRAGRLNYEMRVKHRAFSLEERRALKSLKKLETLLAKRTLSTSDQTDARLLIGKLADEDTKRTWKRKFGAKLRSTRLGANWIKCTEPKPETGYVKSKPRAISVMPFTTSPTRLVSKTMFNPLYLMFIDAEADGIHLSLTSGFRSHADQARLRRCYDNKLSTGQCACSSCNQAARAGTSNHQSGHAADIHTGCASFKACKWTKTNRQTMASPSAACKAETARCYQKSKQYRWLARNAAYYGFNRTVLTEAWHWEWWEGGPKGGLCR